MRLDELTGTRRYQDRDFWAVLRDFEALGGEFMGQGRFAKVIGHRSWPYVLKVFAHDECYRSFVLWAMENPDPCLPRFHGKPRLITPFWKRPETDAALWVVKQERLVHSDRTVVDALAQMVMSADAYIEHDSLPHVEQLLYLDGQARTEIAMIDAELARGVDAPTASRLRSKRRDLTADLNPLARTIRDNRAFWQAHPGTRDFLVMVAEKLLRAPIRCEIDAHGANIMMRPSDGSFVFVDPFWHGMTPYQQHQAMIDAETRGMADDDDVPMMVRGRERSAPRRPPPPQTPLTNDDIPF